MEQENQRVMLTKRLLKESVLRLLQEKEIDRITITELCREAGINRATFYRHYEIPRDILREIAKDCFCEMREQVQLPRQQSDIQAAIENLCMFMEKRMDLMRIILKNSSDTEFMVFVNSIYTEIWDEIRRIRFLSKLRDDEVELLILYSAGGSYFVVRHWLLGNIRMSSKEIAAYLYELLSKADWTGIYRQLGLPL